MIPHTDPWSGLDAWMQEAVASEPRVPDAMQIATAGRDGLPSVRTVLLKEFGAEVGWVFYTNLGSRKGQELADAPCAAAVLHWKSLERQVLARGPITPVSAERADAYWNSRPRGSQLGAWASRQSAELSTTDALTDALREATARFEGSPVPRPPFWSGFHLHATEVEFWQGRPDRLHHRLVFTRTDDGWTRSIRSP